ncbi:MAG: sugar phosphate isomerase/epimerase family protein [Siphonobacter sp.]
MNQNRRSFLRNMGLIAASTIPASNLLAEAAFKKPFFEISIAEWSFHRTLFGKKMTNLDFPVRAKKEFGISTVEYVNQFFKDKAEDTAYLKELLQRCKDNGVKNHLIMCDGEGELGDKDDNKRKKAVENHYKWVEAAKFLGCKTIRVNAAGQGAAEEVMKNAIDGLGRLSEFAAKTGINVIVENHGGYSSNGQWLSSVMKGVNMKNCGTLPDFGNFCIKRVPGSAECAEEYDRYKGTQELMPFAKGVSAKTYNFDAEGNCVETDYRRIMEIVKKSGFKGYVGIEYEGNKLSEDEGIRKTKELIERVGMLV